MTTPPAAPVRFGALDAALILNMTMWAGNIVISKPVTDALPPLGYNAIRFTLSVAGLFVLLRLQKVDLHLPRGEWKWVLLPALFSYALYQPAFIVGLHLTTAANSALIVSIGPLWVVLINAWRTHEPLRRSTVIGVLVGLLGVSIVIVGRFAGQGQFNFGGATLSGDLLIFCASIFWALGVLSARRPLSRNPPLPTSFWMLACGAVSQFVIGVPTLIGFDWQTALTPPVIAAILYSGLLSVAIGTTIFNLAIQRIGPARTAIYSYLQPVIAAAMAVLLLGEAFTPWLLIGGVLTLAGVAYQNRWAFMARRIG